MQGTSGLRGLVSQALEAGFEEMQNGIRLPQVPAGHEEMLPVRLLHGSHTGGQAQEAGGLGVVSFIPLDFGPRLEVLRFGRFVEERPGQQLPGSTVLAGVGEKLAGEFAPEMGFGVPRVGQTSFQPGACLGTASQPPQDVQFLQL